MWGASADDEEKRGAMTRLERELTMRVFSMNRVLILASVIVLGLGPDLVAASHDLHGFHWPHGRNPTTVRLGNNLSGAWHGILATASADWSADRGYPDVVNTTVVAGRSGSGQCRAMAGRVEVCNADYGATGWVGLATVWTQGKHITQGVVQINDGYFQTGDLALPTGKQSVMCQEVGHILGLNHIQSQTCMNNSAAGSAFVSPYPHDNEQLARSYGHKDSKKVASASAFSADELAPPNPTFDALGGATRLVENLGGNRYRVTHVIWAP